jgi:predicted CoA-substrate-specific enzyme activase
MTQARQGDQAAGPARDRFVCGVDVGASATKVVLLQAGRTGRASGQVSGDSLCGRAVRQSGVDYAATARECLAEALAVAGAQSDQVVGTVATGYGRDNVDFADASLTEIHCHGVGAYHFLGQAITVVDIGGQDNKVIRLDDAGGRVDFRMNRKCAAGTGAFIEEIALRLGLPLEEMDSLAGSTTDAVKLSSFCTVFAKTEILAHLRRGVPVAQIARGTFLSVVARILEMAPLDGRVAVTGGVVAHNPTLTDLLAERLGRPVEVPPWPQFTGAVGAALMADRRLAG